jgi:hypothetical protein
LAAFFSACRPIKRVGVFRLYLLGGISADSLGFANFHKAPVMNCENDGTVSNSLYGDDYFLQQLAFVLREFQIPFMCASDAHFNSLPVVAPQ